MVWRCATCSSSGSSGNLNVDALFPGVSSSSLHVHGPVARSCFGPHGSTPAGSVHEHSFVSWYCTGTDRHRHINECIRVSALFLRQNVRLCCRFVHDRHDVSLFLMHRHSILFHFSSLRSLSLIDYIFEDPADNSDLFFRLSVCLSVRMSVCPRLRLYINCLSALVPSCP